MSDVCNSGLMGTCFGHKFEARYSYSDPHIIDFGCNSTSEFIEVLNATKSKTYIYDICTRCGEIRRGEY